MLPTKITKYETELDTDHECTHRSEIHETSKSAEIESNLAKSAFVPIKNVSLQTKKPSFTDPEAHSDFNKLA
jgi:hypothetical protein